MKKKAKRIFIMTISVFAAAMLLSFAERDAALQAAAEDENKMTDTETVSVIFTHDMHSHLDADKKVKDGKTVEVGGFAKLKTAIDTVKSEYPDSFVLDAGDFSMGTPYQTIFSEQACELKMMKYLGFDATTLGNHEFDYRATGLTSMLQAAKGKGPTLVAANIDWKATLADDSLKKDAAVLKTACEDYGVKDYIIVEHNGIKAAVFGLMGENAVEYAPESGLIFKDAEKTAEKIVSKIKAEGKADIIICLSHCGTIENEKDKVEGSEDYHLAEAVPDIDLIVSGHSHTLLNEPLQVGDTYIVSCGSYNANMGHIVLEADDSGGAASRYGLEQYDIIPLDEKVDGATDVDAELTKYRQLLNSEYFNDYGYDVDQVIAKNDIDFTPIEEFGLVQGEDTLGNLIADSYKYVLARAGDETQIAVVPSGVIRASFMKGDITVADAFNVSALGYGKDGKAGYPLVKVYLTGRELKAAAEVDVSISDFMGVARLYSSGLEYSWNPNRLILNRAVDVSYNDDEKIKAIEDDKLYSVVTDLYSCQMLGTVKDKSFGLLKIEPKDGDGKVIENFEKQIVYSNGQEIKAWYALASYIDSFAGDTVPEYYADVQGRKTEIDSLNPVELCKQPNKIVWIALALVVTLILMVVLAIKAVKKRHRKRAEIK